MPIRRLVSFFFVTSTLFLSKFAHSQEMLTWPHSGFTLDAGTRIESGDRDALRRLLLYVLRPALSLKC